MNEQPEALLRHVFDAAVAAAAPARCVPKHLPAPPEGKTVVVGAGKAVAAMAKAVEDHYPAEVFGTVVTRYGHAGPTRCIEVLEAGHPTPDDAGVRASERIMSLARGTGPDDLLLVLISGGGSALLTLPPAGITLADKRQVSEALIRSGATIDDINRVRKHMSAIKGGRLAAEAGAGRIVSLLISDVAGDDPSVIASGPTVGDPSTLSDARRVLERYHIDIPRSVRVYLEDPAHETPKPDDPCFQRTQTVLVATPRQSLDAAAEIARQAGVSTILLGDAIEGESHDVAATQASLAREAAADSHPGLPPRLLLSGGETTVTVRGTGRGGPNTEFLLALAIALDGHPGIYAIACDTDGIDGTEDNAGAIIRPDTLRRAAGKNLDPRALIAGNNAYLFFDALGDLVRTGPTQTNVNDFRAILVT
jgi:hydroxypyruvate reductase